MNVFDELRNLDYMCLIGLLTLNKEWFEANKHLTNEQMLAAGLIDECDLIWINQLRGEPDEISMV